MLVPIVPSLGDESDCDFPSISSRRLGRYCYSCHRFASCLSWILPSGQGDDLFLVKMPPALNLLGGAWLGHNHRLRPRTLELSEGGLVAMVVLMLADNHNVWYRYLLNGRGER